MTVREQQQTAYWQIAHPYVVSISNDMIRDFVMGKKVTESRRLSLLHNLWFYLDIIEQQREIDLINGLFYPLSYYRTLYCIDKIQKQLQCTGIEGKTIADLINVYIGDTSNGGIGSMIIQGAVNPFHIRGNSGQTTGFATTTVPVNVWQSFTTYIINNITNSCCTVKATKTNISADSVFLNLIPGNYKFNDVVFENKTANWAQLSMGITSGGNECFACSGMNLLDLTTKGLTTIAVNKTFSLTTPTTIYLHHAGVGDDWNNAIFNIEFIFEKL